MKHLMILTLLASFFSVSAFSAEGQTTTECPMMKEQNRRVNTKLNLDTSVKKPVHVRGSKARGA